MAAACVAAALLLRWLVSPCSARRCPTCRSSPPFSLRRGSEASALACWRRGCHRRRLYIWFLLPVGLLKMPAPYDLRSLASVHDHRRRHRLSRRRDEEGRSRAERRAASEWRTTLASIGDGVIVTDTARARPLPQRGRRAPDGMDDHRGAGAGRSTRSSSSPTRTRTSRSRTRCGACCAKAAPIGLANHTLLKHRQGRWRPIADSGAPVRNDFGEIDGVVLVFRDQTAERDVGPPAAAQPAPAAGRSATSRRRSPTSRISRAVICSSTRASWISSTSRTEEILGRTDIDRFGAEIAERFRSMDRRVVEANGPLTEEEIVPLDDRRAHLSVGEVSAVGRGRQAPTPCSVCPPTSPTASGLKRALAREPAPLPGDGGVAAPSGLDVPAPTATATT